MVVLNNDKGGEVNFSVVKKEINHPSFWDSCRQLDPSTAVTATMLEKLDKVGVGWCGRRGGGGGGRGVVQHKPHYMVMTGRRRGRSLFPLFSLNFLSSYHLLLLITTSPPPPLLLLLLLLLLLPLPPRCTLCHS